jgi:hypothetical protein
MAEKGAPRFLSREQVADELAITMAQVYACYVARTCAA